MGLQISVNVVLFVITAIHCNRVKSEIHRMQMNDNCEQKKKRYIADKAMWVECVGDGWYEKIYGSFTELLHATSEKFSMTINWV